jgi:hypothetical protein
MRNIVEWLLLVPVVAAGCSSAPETQVSKSTKETASVSAPAPPAPGASSLELAPRVSPGGDIHFESVLDLHQDSRGVLPQLRGGMVVAASVDWPASLFARFSTPDGMAVCTATLIGPQVMLTAAHCVPVSGNVSFTLAGKDYQTSCVRHPRYGMDESSDYGLCKVSTPVMPPAGFKYETVDSSPIDSMRGKDILLSGYGCISDLVANRTIDGKFRIGFNVVKETSPFAAQPGEKNNLLTNDDPGRANLCPGDSGGAAYRLLAGTGLLANRVVVAVNSRVFYTDSTKTRYGASLLSSLGGPDFRGWAENWAKNVAQVPACGIAGAIPNCRM